MGFAEDSDNVLSEEFGAVLTPTRLQQSLVDVPASVTVITREMIDRLGARTVPDALRLVPGMIVGQASGNEWRISYHGSNGLVPRRMQVLIDGVSVYHTGFAEVTWSVLPVSIEDIERIEVTRSPSAATYGANSYLGVINILTRHPSDAQETVIKANVGALHTKDGYVASGTKIGSTAIRASFAHQQDTGFDRNDKGQERRDNTQLNRFDLKTTTEFDRRTALDVQAAYVSAGLQREFADSRQVSYPDEASNNMFVSGTWSRHFESHRLQVKAYGRNDYRNREWRSCYPTIMFSPELRALNAANPSYVTTLLKGKMPTGGSAADNQLLAAVLGKMKQLGASALAPMCGDTGEEQIEQQLDLELQDAWVISNQLRSVWGAGVRKDGYHSVTFVNGDVDYRSYRVFATTEYKPAEPITVNLGGMWEYSSRRTEGGDFSPRIGLNYHFNTNQALRLIYSRATRTPDALETARDWNYYASNLAPLYNGSATGIFYHNARADRTLVPERIVSKEISYYLAVPQANLAIDVKAFEEHLTDLISEKLQFFDYHPTNSGEVRLRGAEAQIEWKPTRRVSSWLSYAYLDNSTDTPYEKSLNARHSGAAVIGYMWPQDWQTTVAYVGNSALGGLTAFGRTDLIVSRAIRSSGHRLDAQFRLSKLDATTNRFTVSQSYSVENDYKNTYQVYGSLKLTFL